MRKPDPEPEDDLFEFDESEVLAAVREEAATAYPNPERVDCPGREVLEAIARGRMDRAEAKAHYSHITHCSPCWSEYREIRGRTRGRRAAGGAALGILMLAAGWFGYRGWGPEPAELVADVTLDLRRAPNMRGGGAERRVVGTLPRGRVNLTIYLPVGSEEGAYVVEIRSNSQRLGSVVGEAHRISGAELLKVSILTARLAPGPYELRLRHQMVVDWETHTVRIE